MLANEEPNIVSTCAFPPAREEMAMAAMAAGAKALWIEKLFALTLDAAKRIMAEPPAPHLWQVTVRFKKGGSFGIHIEKATGRILLPVD